MGTDEIIQNVIKLLQDAYSKQLASDRGINVTIEGFTVKYEGSTFKIDINMPEYWRFIENGTRPHFPPVDKILEWVKVKKILPRAKNGKIPSQKSLAFAIAKKISKTGTKGIPSFQKAMNAFDFKNKILNAAFLKYKADLDAVFEEFYKNRSQL